MIYPCADKVEKMVGDKYSLVIAAAKRAKQLLQGAPKLVEASSKNPITIALEELAAGKIKVITPTVAETAARMKAESDERKRSPISVDMLKIGGLDDLDLATSLDVEDAIVLSDAEDQEHEDILEEYPLVPADTDDENTDIEGQPVEEEEEFNNVEDISATQNLDEPDEI